MDTDDDTGRVDLTTCEAEPIHRLGAVQSHGVVLVVDPHDLAISRASENGADLLGCRPETLLGRPLDALFAHDVATRMAKAPEAGGTVAGDCFAVTPHAATTTHTATVHRHAGMLIVELEPREPNEEDGWRHWRDDVEGLLAALPSGDAGRVGQHLCERLQAASGFDRVWLYRFDPDWSGEVVAEARVPVVPPYLGLRYPASDIPPQARALYHANLLRVIADVGATPVGLLGGDPAEPPDLSHAVLRSVSRFHIEYLQNLGVGATATLSLLVDGVLWGMFSFHHCQPRRTPWYVRAALRRVAGAYADRIAHEQAAQRRQARTRTVHDLARFRAELVRDARPLAALLLQSPGLPQQLGADAAAVLFGERVAVVGDTPDADWVRAFGDWMAARRETNLLVASALDRTYPPAASVHAVASGVAAVLVSHTPRILLAAFRAEQAREVFWGGDPAHPVIVDGPTHRVSPRKSFDLWRQIVRGTSQPWEPDAGDRLVLLLDELLRFADEDPVRLHELMQADAESLMHDAEANVAAVSGLDGSPDGILVLADDGSTHRRVVHANRRLCTLIGIDLEHLASEALERELETLGLARPAGVGAGPREIDVWSPRLGHRVVEITVRRQVRLEGRSDAAELTVSTFADVTAHRRLSDALAASRDRAEAANRAKEAMLRAASHELRTPLNAIVGFSEILLAENDRLAADQLQMVRDVHAAGVHLTELVSGMLDLTGLELAARAHDEEWFDLASLVREVASWMGPLANPKNLHVEVAGADTPLPFLGCRRQVRQILVNLLTNAVKFTPANGTVGLATAVTPGGEPSLRVWDTGIGIAEEHRTQIFEPFHQVDASLSRRYEGIGLGLTLVRAFVELHSGTITVTSSPGRGAAFTIVFPSARRGPG